MTKDRMFGVLCRGVCCAFMVLVLVGVSKAGNIIDCSKGFEECRAGLTANGEASFVAVMDTRIARLTSGEGFQAGSIFSNQQVAIDSFQTTFTIHIHTPGSNPFSDGMTFTIQGNAPTALGPEGGGLGYGPDGPRPGERGIRNSVAIKFDIFNNAGEGINSTGIFTDGRSPTVRESGLPESIPDQSITLGDPSNPANVINLHSQHPMSVCMAYDGTALSVTITDTVTMGSETQSYTVDIPSFVGGDTAYVGFTAATGRTSATQDVQTWIFQPLSSGESNRGNAK